MKLRNATLCVLLALLSVITDARAGYLDLFLPSVVAPAGAPPNGIVFAPVGGGGAFSGTLDGTLVTGGMGAGAGTNINPTLIPQTGFGTIGFSTTDNTSPQHSYPGIYTPTIPLSDRVGYSSVYAGGPLFAPVSIVFSSPILNPVIHVASLDFSYLWFDIATNAANGATGAALLSGNGGGGDGLTTSIGGAGIDAGGFRIHDAALGTSDPVFPPTDHNDTVPPLMAGPRSAYGSVQFFGLMTGLDFEIRNGTLGLGGLSPGGIDNATFTLTPEPSTFVFAALGILGLMAGARRRTFCLRS